MSEKQAQIQQESAEQLAKRIQRANHLYQIKCGDNYRCIYCGAETPAVLWANDGDGPCPKCGTMYNPIDVYDMIE